MAQNSDVQYVAYLRAKFNLEDDELLQVFSMSQQQPPDTGVKGVEDYEEEEEVVEEEEEVKEEMNDESYEEIVEEEYEDEVMDGSFEEMVMDASGEEQPRAAPQDPEAGGGAIVEATSDAMVEQTEGEDAIVKTMEDDGAVKVSESFVQDTPMMPEDVPDDEARADTGAIVPATSTAIVPVPEQAPPIQDKDAQQQPRDEKEEEGKSGFATLLLCLCLLLLIAIAVILILIFATETIPKFWEDDDDGPVRMGDYDPGNCDLGSQGTQPNFAGQCECGEEVRVVAGYTRDRYNELLGFIQPGIVAVWPFDITSCDPANLALLWLSTGPAIDDELRLRQRYILAYLYYGTEGQQWSEQTNWLSNENECVWFGIDCAVQELTAIELPGNSLNGQIPSEMRILTNLETLSLDQNTLRGRIPGDLFTIPALTELTLSSNQMIGSIPTQIGRATGLEVLRLNSNVLQGSLPTQMNRLVRLRSLSLARNPMLSGRIPTEFGQFTDLESLSLSNTNIRARIPTEYGALTKLEEFRIASTLVGGDIPVQFGRLTRLTYIDLSESRFRQALPPFLGDLTALTYLALNGNELEGPIPTELAKLTRLRTLQLDNNDFSGLLPTEFGRLTLLETLTIEGNPYLTGNAPSEVCELRDDNLERFTSDCPGREFGILCPIPSCCSRCTDLPEEFDAPEEPSGG